MKKMKRNSPHRQCHRLVGVGAINGDSTIRRRSVIKLNTKAKQERVEETDGSDNSLLGVGAINGYNIIKEDSFNQLTTIGTGEQRNVIIERNKKIDQLKKKTNGSNNKLFGIGAINGNNTIGPSSFMALETIAGEREIRTKAKERKVDSNNYLYEYGPYNTTKTGRITRGKP